jgi:hypothetical protein
VHPIGGLRGRHDLHGHGPPHDDQLDDDHPEHHDPFDDADDHHDVVVDHDRHSDHHDHVGRRWRGRGR